MGNIVNVKSIINNSHCSTSKKNLCFYKLVTNQFHQEKQPVTIKYKLLPVVSKKNLGYCVYTNRPIITLSSRRSL